MSLPSAVARALAELLAPLAVAMESPDNLAALLADLGWDVELLAEDMPAIADVLPVADRVLELIATAEDLADGTAEAGELVEDIVTAATAVFGMIDDLAGLTEADLAELADPLDDPATWAELAAGLPAYLLLQWVRGNHPLAFALLVLGGVVRSVDRDGGLPPSLELSWEALGDLLGNPTGHLASVYGWGGEFDHARLLSALGATLRAAGVDARLDALPATVADAHYGGPPPAGVLALDAPLIDQAAAGYIRLGLVVAPVPVDGGAEPAGLLISHEVLGATGARVDLGGGLTLTLAGGAELTGALGVVVGPDGTTLAPGAAAVGASVRLDSAPELARPLVGDGEGTRVELRTTFLELAAAGSSADPELIVEAGGELALVIEPADADSLLAELLGAVQLAILAQTSLRMSSTGGVTLGGQLGFELSVPLDVRIGPIHIMGLGIVLVGGPEGGTLVVTVTGSATLGPFTVTVQEIGIAAALTAVTAGRSGTFGSTDLTLAFKPPSGLGFALDLGVVTGGGFIYVEPDGTGYAGILDFGVLSVRICAVGIVDTALPGGGWSLFLALYIGIPSVQLGFGFTLTGVGGLAGVHRGLDTAALLSVIRQGDLDNLLFPPDPIANAPVIIAQLDAVFPSAAGRYTFGPVVRIGWGTPTLVEATLGVVISVPEPIVVAVLGTVTAVLPVEELDLVALHLDVAGVIDTGAQTLTIDASLHDSHVIGFALSGDMSLRAAFGDLPSFLLALGGFHPGFDPLVGFPTMQRLSLAIDAGSVLQVHFDCYFGISSNTVQFGARIEIEASIEGFGIEGGTEFDAVVQFSPFLVTTHLGFHVAITAGSVDLAGVWLDATVSGPNPWHITGFARFKLLGFEEELPVDETIGRRRDEPAVEAADVRQQIRDALGLEGAWSVSTPGTGVDPDVTVSAIELAPGELVADPASVVTVAQQAAPLGLPLDKAGDAPVGGYTTFLLEAGTGGLAASGSVLDWFAPGYFLELAPTEGLSSPSFELLTAGIEVGGGDAVAGPDRRGSLTFEQILLDPELEQNVRLTPLDVLGDARYSDLAGLATTTRHGFTTEPVAAADIVDVLDTDFALTDRHTGDVRAIASTWSATHQIIGLLGAETVLAPAWEQA